MERHFVLPVTFAFAIHGLLFALPRGTVPETGDDGAEVAPGDPVPPTIELTPDTPRRDETSTDSGGTPNPTPRRIDAPQIERTGGFTVPVELRPVTTVNPRAEKIDIGDFAPTGRGGGDLPTSDIVSRAMLDRTPHARVQIAPDCPFSARREGRTGQVTVEFVVDEAGRVVAPHVAGSSDPVFNDAAVRAVSKWRFEPGTVRGRVVRFRMAVPVVFRLDEGSSP